MRVIKRNLREGSARLVDRETGQNRTGEFLKDPRVSEAERLPRFDHMARDAGIAKIDDQLYGVLSVIGRANPQPALFRTTNTTR